PGRWARPGGVCPGDDGGVVAVRLLPGRAVQPGDRKAMRAGRGLPGDLRRAGAGSRHPRPVPPPRGDGGGGGVPARGARCGRGRGLRAGEGRVRLGGLSLDGTKLAGNAAQKANRTLPQIEKLLAEAAAADAAEDARLGDKPDEPTPRTLARRAERRQRLAAARDRLAAEDQAPPDAPRPKP